MGIERDGHAARSSVTERIDRDCGGNLVSAMAKMRKKSELPSKECLSCGRPFVWRKKWERDWESVKFCSDACRQRGAAHDGRVHSAKSPRAASTHRAPHRDV